MSEGKRYEVMDNRTGYDEGSIIELSDQELVLCPFNVYLKRLDPVGDKERLDMLAVDADKQALINLLRDKGLSPNRTVKVVSKYPSLAVLERHASNAGVDELTDALIKKELGKNTYNVSKPKKASKKKALVEPEEEIKKQKVI